VPGAAAPPDAGAEASSDFVAAAVREGGGMWRRSGDAESGQASRILPPDLILLALISNFSSIFGREREQKHRIHFWVFYSCHYNCLEECHYYSHYWKFTITILHTTHPCPDLGLRRTWAHCQAAYFRIGRYCPSFPWVKGRHARASPDSSPLPFFLPFPILEQTKP